MRCPKYEMSNITEITITHITHINHQFLFPMEPQSKFPITNTNTRANDIASQVCIMECGEKLGGPTAAPGPEGKGGTIIT